MADESAALPVVIRPADDEDLEWMAGLHMAQLPHGFFTALGPRFLRAYHRTFMHSPNAVALVAEIDREPVGFVIGAVNAIEHRRSVMQAHGVRLAASGARSLMVRPALAAEFVRTRAFRYLRAIRRSLRRSSGVSASTQVAGPGCAVLAHAAVGTSSERRGAGSALVRAFAAAVAERGATRIELVTLADDRGAADFYSRLGWQPVGPPTKAEFRRFELELR